MPNKINGVLISRDNKGTLKAEMITFTDTLQNLYEIVGCELVEMPTRRIINNDYIFIIDEEGTFHPEKPINAVLNDGREFLVGNILIVGLDDGEGNITSLTLRQQAEIIKHCQGKEYLIYQLRSYTNGTTN